MYAYNYILYNYAGVCNDDHECTYNSSTFDQALICVAVIMNHSEHSNRRQESGVALRNFLIQSFGMHANLK